MYLEDIKNIDEIFFSDKINFMIFLEPKTYLIVKKILIIKG
jgi:hypothetical protein